MQNTLALNLCQGEQHTADKLTANVSRERVIPCRKRTFYGDATLVLFKEQIVLTAKVLINCHRAAQKGWCTNEGDLFARKQAQGQEKAHCAAAFSARQDST